MNWPSIRALFPAAERYTYLNTAGCGLMSTRTADRAKDFYNDFLHNSGNDREKWGQDAERIRALAAGFINASANELAFVPDAATGINLISRMYTKKMDVLVTSNEFASVNLPWVAAGHNLQMLETGSSGAIGLDRIADAITEHTEMLCISHVHFDTGYRNDLEALGKLCKERNILFLADTTQSLGAYPVDVKKMHIDILVSNCYKWITAGFGITLLYISQDILERWKVPALGSYSMLSPPVTSIRQNLMNLKQSASVLEIGQPDFENIFRLESALQLLNEIGVDNIHQRVSELSDYLYSQLAENAITVHYPFEEKHRSALVMAEGDMTTVHKLKEKNIIVSPSRGKGIRISPHFYNVKEDIDILCRELKELKH